MCGIAALWAYRESAPDVEPAELRRIREHMAARGPDGLGEWAGPDGRIALGHRRLSIIDLSDQASQPMESRDGSAVLTFNGEIYNYRALRQQLEAGGATFRTQSDTEVILHLYAQKGERLVHDLRGMFAFALWDARKRALLLARDPYGIKPLYYADDGRTIRVASQVKALLAGGRVSTSRDPAGLVGFLLLGSVPEPWTIYEGVRALPAGSWLRVTSEGVEPTTRYCSIADTFRHASAQAENFDGPELQEVIRATLLDSVRHHLVADVPVGAFLSAGVDSGSLVGLMREATNADIRTVTLAFEEFAGTAADEAPTAELVAHQYGTTHTTRVVSDREFREDWPRILDAMDQPSIDGVNTWLVSKAAAELGVKVAISGLGGDELFGGYPSFHEIPRSVRMFRLPSYIPWSGTIFRWGYAALNRACPILPPKGAGLLEYGGTYGGAYLLKRGLFMPWELHRVIDRDTAEAGLRRLDPLGHIQAALSPDPGSPYTRVATLESSLYMRNQLLRDADWAGMAHSVEIRTPLVDRWVLEALAPVLAAQPQRLGKELLANAPSPPLDRSCTARPKTGFATPLASWVPGMVRAAGSTYRNGTYRNGKYSEREKTWPRQLARTMVRALAV